MGGIAGMVNFQENLREQTAVAYRMAETLRRRGPDEGGFYFQEEVCLIHRRLAVIDPAHGQQPMRGERQVLIYDGEIYNAPELRQDLEGLGHAFGERSDTEVLLHAYRQWGPACLQRLNGMYAFAVWDEEERALFLARDRMGAKPLFFYEEKHGLVFGSQIRTLLAHPAVPAELDADGLRELFFLGPGRTAGNGVLRGVRELLPGEYALVTREGMRRHRYWSLQAREHEDSFAVTVQRTRELIMDGVRRQLAADAPVCTLLSGGLDSSITTYIAAAQHARGGGDGEHRFTTFSVDYEDNDKYFRQSAYQPDADGRYIELMVQATGVENRRVVLDNGALAAALPDAMRARDLPGMADIDASLLLFGREIRREFTVGLSGECADEIFGGYPWFHQPFHGAAGGFPWSRSMRMRASVLREGVLPGGGEYAAQRMADTLRQVDGLPADSEKDREVRALTVLILQWFAQTLLDRTDRMAMDCGLEIRMPFCDHRLVEYAYNMPWAFKAYQQREKGIVREAFKHLLPFDVVWRKKSPYPKTHSPAFLRAVSEGVRRMRADGASPLAELLDWGRVEQLMEEPDASEENWYGQLMRTPQVLAYLLQMDEWLRTYHVRLV